jgi:hypothetical protein
MSTARATAAVTALATLLVAARAADEVGGLLENGSFERTEKGEPVGWRLPEAGAEIAKEKDNHFLRITVKDEGKTVQARQTIELQPAWKALIVKARIRTKDVRPGAQQTNEPRVSLFFTDVRGQQVGGWPEMPRLERGAGWEEQTIRIDVPAKATVLQVRPGMDDCTGTADFDDLEILPVGR